MYLLHLNDHFPASHASLLEEKKTLKLSQPIVPSNTIRQISMTGRAPAATAAVQSQSSPVLGSGCCVTRCHLRKVHPGRLTWNLRIHPWKTRIIFQNMIFRFYVNLRRCRCSKYLLGFLRCFTYMKPTSQKIGHVTFHLDISPLDDTVLKFRNIDYPPSS